MKIINDFIHWLRPNKIDDMRPHVGDIIEIKINYFGLKKGDLREIKSINALFGSLSYSVDGASGTIGYVDVLLPHFILKLKENK